jgi:hypothetical protein
MLAAVETVAVNKNVSEFSVAFIAFGAAITLTNVRWLHHWWNMLQK